MTTRIEKDSMGELEVPADALYGAQTQRAINNFPISRQRLPAAFIRSLLQAKAAAAEANVELGLLPRDMGDAIVQSVDALLRNPEMTQHFPIDVFQTGSGTSSNMNANEVLASLAKIYSMMTSAPMITLTVAKAAMILFRAPSILLQRLSLSTSYCQL